MLEPGDPANQNVLTSKRFSSLPSRLKSRCLYTYARVSPMVNRELRSSFGMKRDNFLKGLG